MEIKTKYIFGCIHENRNILSTTMFERGLELPAVFCKNCIPVCNICLKKIKTKTYDKLELCNKCHAKVITSLKN